MSKVKLSETEKVTCEMIKNTYEYFYCKTHGLVSNSVCMICGEKCESRMEEIETTTFHVLDKGNLLNVQREITTFEVIENGLNVGYAKLTKTNDILLLSFDVPQRILRGKHFEGLSSADFKIHLTPISEGKVSMFESGATEIHVE